MDRKTSLGKFPETSVTLRLNMHGPQQRRVVDGMIGKLRRAGVACEIIEKQDGSELRSGIGRGGSGEHNAN